jgi:hypothetical protein
MRRPRKITFVVTDAPNHGFTARAVGHAIFTEADSWADLPARIRDAVRCHFGAAAPRIAFVYYSERNGAVRVVREFVLPLDAE